MPRKKDRRDAEQMRAHGATGARREKITREPMAELGPWYVNAAEVPHVLLMGMVRMALGGKPPGGTLYAEMCEWADQYGGDVIIEIGKDHPLRKRSRTPAGYVLGRVRFVSPRV
jgi:hypothetical protein